jgi:hypothetical protein
MSIETFLSTASFAISLGGLVPVFFFKDRRREVALAVIIAALVAMSGAPLFRAYQHDQLSHNTWTFDQLYEELHYVPFPVVNEALFRLVEKRMVGHRIIEFRGNDGSMLRVRGYYIVSQR